MSIEVDAAPRSRDQASRGFAWAVVVLAAAALVVLITVRGATPLPMTEEDVIAAGLEAWFGGDPAAVSAVFEPGLDGVAVSESQVEYQAAIGGKARLLGCRPGPTARLDCEVEYSNALNDAVGSPPFIVPMTFGVSEGKIVRVNTFHSRNYFPADVELESSFANLMAVSGLAEDYHEVCIPYAERGASCAGFQLAHLDEWASWHRSQG
ncbi:MAG TPA: hypothetical protein VGC03_16760 [Acidimicrobiia bacterium]|jgi:hypothetical protein